MGRWQPMARRRMITLRSWPALWPTDISPQSKKLQIVRRTANMVAPAVMDFLTQGGVRRVTSQRSAFSRAGCNVEGLLGTRTTIPSWACRIIAFGTRIKFFTVAQVAVSQELLDWHNPRQLVDESREVRAFHTDSRSFGPM